MQAGSASPRIIPTISRLMGTTIPAISTIDNYDSNPCDRKADKARRLPPRAPSLDPRPVRRGLVHRRDRFRRADVQLRAPLGSSKSYPIGSVSYIIGVIEVAGAP